MVVDDFFKAVIYNKFTCLESCGRCKNFPDNLKMTVAEFKDKLIQEEEETASPFTSTKKEEIMGPKCELYDQSKEMCATQTMRLFDQGLEEAIYSDISQKCFTHPACQYDK